MTGATEKTGPLLVVLKLLLFTAGFALGAGLLLYLISPEAFLTGLLLRSGLIALMATPGLRIFVAVAEWLKQYEFRFVAIAALVVLELALTIWFAEHIHP